MSIEVSGLYTYPIKSCSGIELDTAELTERGLPYDREWMLVDANNEQITQREHPELALVACRIEGEALCITAPNQGTVGLPLSAEYAASNEEVPVIVFKKPGTGLDQGELVADYFSGYLKEPARLLRLKQARQIKPEVRVAGASQSVGFADGFALTLGSMPSLCALNEHLDQAVPMNRFRKNIVVDGPTLEAYDEDFWRNIQIGALSAYVIRAAGRCPIPNIDQSVGELPRMRPVTKALHRTRAGIDSVNNAKSNFFGQNLTFDFLPGVRVTVGDEVQILHRSAERNFELTATANA